MMASIGPLSPNTHSVSDSRLNVYGSERMSLVLPLILFGSVAEVVVVANECEYLRLS